MFLLFFEKVAAGAPGPRPMAHGPWPLPPGRAGVDETPTRVLPARPAPGEGEGEGEDEGQSDCNCEGESENEGEGEGAISPG